MSYDLIVIGAGPAGYVGAIKAAQLGKKVAVVDKDRAGGTCNNWGCIPAKALLHDAEFYYKIRNHAAASGITVEGLSHDWDKIIQRSRSVADKGAAGVEYLFRKNKIDFLKGEARLDRPGTVTVKSPDGSEAEYQAEHILIATGVVTRPFPGLSFNGTTVIGSKAALALPVQPKSAIVIGAGAIGIEFASIWNDLGTRVTVVEMMPNILPVEDTEISQLLEKSLTKQGITILSNHKTLKAEADDKGARITVADASGAEKLLEADLVLVAIGVVPLLPGGGLALELTDRGYLKTGEHYETSVPGIYGAGDIIGPPWLAHVASYEAIQAVSGMFIPDFTPKKVETFPGCTYCHPQVASIGLTERAAKEKGIPFKIGKFPYSASGKARAINESEGLVKLVIGEPHGEILGAHLIGAEATEMLGELSLGIMLEATIEELEETIHSHPTLSEMVKEAAEVAAGHPLHL